MVVRGVARSASRLASSPTLLLAILWQAFQFPSCRYYGGSSAEAVVSRLSLAVGPVAGRTVQSRFQSASRYSPEGFQSFLEAVQTMGAAQEHLLEEEVGLPALGQTTRLEDLDQSPEGR